MDGTAGGGGATAAGGGGGKSHRDSSGEARRRAQWSRDRVTIATGDEEEGHGGPLG